jgi:hypothetical protein
MCVFVSQCVPSAFFLRFTSRLFDRVFHSQPVEQRALGLVFAGCDSDQAPNEMGSENLLLALRR